MKLHLQAYLDRRAAAPSGRQFLTDGMRRPTLRLFTVGLLLGWAVSETRANDLPESEQKLQQVQRQLQSQAEQLDAQRRELEAQRRHIEQLREAIGSLEGAEAPPATVEAVPEANPWTEQIEVGFEKGFYIETVDDRYAFHVRFLLQSGYEYLDADSATDRSTFEVKRGQLRLFGNVLDPRLKYKMMLMGRSTGNGEDNLALRDLWVDWQWTRCVQVQAGQFFVYYDYEDLQPSWALPLVNRSIINANLGFERDIGVRLHGKLGRDQLRYSLYAMNGEGRNTLNTGNDMLYGVRLDYQLLGRYQYLLPDIRQSDSSHVALGAAAIYNSGNAAPADQELYRFTTDLALRCRGWHALCLLNLARNEDLDVTDYGFLGQLGFFAVPGRLELVARWARISQDGASGADVTDPEERTFGLNYYIHEHRAKLQADYSLLPDAAAVEDRDDNRVRVQLQLFF